LPYNNGTARIYGDRNSAEGEFSGCRDRKKTCQNRKENKNRQKWRGSNEEKGGREPELVSSELDECENKDRQGNMYEILREDMDDLSNNIGGVEKENAENNSYTDGHGGQ
jgi:hypothetical protein